MRLTEDSRRANPPEQLAEYEASRTSVDPEWTNAEVLEMILDGCDQLGDHVDPDDYDPGDLLEMWRTCHMLCPLHLSIDYPVVPSGVWGRDVAGAWDRLTATTVEHTGKSSALLATEAGLIPPDREVCGHVIHATPDELQQTWADYPHAKWYFEDQDRQGFIAVEVVE